jgi:hypothetical protein
MSRLAPVVSNPTTQGSTPPRRLLGLLLMWATILFGGFLFGLPDEPGAQRMPLETRMLSSLTLVVAGWAWWWTSRNSDVREYAQLMATGMTLGFVGDLFMARLLPVPEPVLGGIAAFGLGHIAYIAAMRRFAGDHALDTDRSRWGAWATWLAIGGVGWYVVVFRGQDATALHWAALPYALLLASTAGIASGIALQAPVFTPLALGAALFLFSDLILAARLFNDLDFPMINDVVWLTYGPGQAMIVYSVGAARRLAATSGRALPAPTA